MYSSYSIASFFPLRLDSPSWCVVVMARKSAALMDSFDLLSVSKFHALAFFS